MCLNTCLNGIIDPGEECDDANTAACFKWPHCTNVKDKGLRELWRIPPCVFHVVDLGEPASRVSSRTLLFHTAFCEPSSASIIINPCAASEFSDDGCANCIVEPGWSCRVPSKLSRHCKHSRPCYSKSVCPVPIASYFQTLYVLHEWCSKLAMILAITFC